MIVKTSLPENIYIIIVCDYNNVIGNLNMFPLLYKDLFILVVIGW